MQPRLKLFSGNDDQPQADFAGQRVVMQLDEFTRILADAVVWDRTWLQDMADERINVSQDLYEVLTIYDDVRNTSA